MVQKKAEKEVAVPQAPYPEIHCPECKGCGRCVATCPKQVLQMSEDFNDSGYHYAVYTGDGCTGCGLCFYSCPEPYALCVHKKKS
ncbi:MAG: 4Fe-4S dicluster domain-containing protein [Lentisphaeria bacterium]